MIKNMTLDIREFPITYINMPNRHDRDEYIKKHLSNRDFKHIVRSDGISHPVPYFGVSLAHIAAAWHMYRTTDSEYFTVIEDDAYFTDIDGINDMINRAFSNEDCHMLVSTHDIVDGVDLCTPPIENIYTAHCIVYKRIHVPERLLFNLKRAMERGCVDRWGPWDINVYAGYSRHCVQLNHTFRSDADPLGKQNYMVILCDSPFTPETDYMSVLSDIIGKDNIYVAMVYKLAYIDENQKCLNIMIETGDVFNYPVPAELQNMIDHEKPTVTALMAYLIEKDPAVVYTVIDSERKIYKYAPQK